MILFLAGAIPLFYMAVAGLRILLPGYQLIVPLAQSTSGSYLPSVALMTAGTLVLLQGLVLVTGLSGLYFGLVTTLGVISTYLTIGLPVMPSVVKTERITPRNSGILHARLPSPYKIPKLKNVPVELLVRGGGRCTVSVSKPPSRNARREMQAFLRP